MKLFRLAFLTLATLGVAASAQTIRTLRWAAIGNGIVTTGTNGYPARLGARLPADSVIAFGAPGATALKSGDSSYWSSGQLAQVFAYQPDIVSIHLGGNDSKSGNWADSANFERDYKALIDTLASMPSQPRIVVVYPTPIFQSEPQGVRQNLLAQSIIPKLRKIAKDKGADTADLNTPFVANSSLFSDGFVATNAGNDSLARHLFNAFVEQSIRIMCVGNSITFGHGLNAKEAYPITLNKLLGKRYWVWNGGKSGWWMQRAQLPGASSQYKSYVTDKAQMDTLFLRKPHFITLKLGTNDARQNFWNTSRFIADYQYFIDTLYNNMNPKPKILPIKAFPAWRLNGNWQFANGGSGNTAETNGINGDIIRDSLGPAIDAIALSRPAQVAGIIDLYAPFVSTTPTLAPDGVHPNKAGMDSVARVIYKSLLPIVTSIRAASPGKAFAPARPAAQALRVIRTGSAKPARENGFKSLDGRSAGKNALASGVYVQPAAGEESRRAPQKDAGKK